MSDYKPEFDANGNINRLVWSPSVRKEPENYPLTCESCGGDLLAGRNATVCERGCPIHHKTPVGWLEKRHPERKIFHLPHKQAEAAIEKGCKQLAAFDRDDTEAK